MGVSAAILTAAACAAKPAEPPLWSGSKFTRGERDRALLRGLEYIHELAEDPETFDNNIGDFLWCDYAIVATTPDPHLRYVAQSYGQKLAERWKAKTRGLPLEADMHVVWELASTLYVAESLGVPYETLREQLEPRIAAISVEDWLDFDPRREPPPTKRVVLKGKEACAAAGREAPVGGSCPDVKFRMTDLDIFYDAMITTYFGDRFGVTHGASFEDFARWLPQLYPYPTKEEEIGGEAFYDLIYVVTHVVYTHNDYGELGLSPLDLPEEFQFLRQTFHIPIEDEDCETYAEYVDTLKSFGVSPEDDRNMALAIESLMALQNVDGSWGAVELDDVYDRFHTTWTAIEALRDYRFAASPSR
ncbi:hypothetical protein ACFL6C_04770 [Myxococcota bacterium]